MSQGPLNSTDRNLGMFCHLGALSVFVGVPFGNILAPLIIWLIRREDSPFVDRQGKESLNFQLSMVIYGIISVLLMFILIGFITITAVVVVDILFTIVASVKASRGESYHYPLTIQFLR